MTAARKLSAKSHVTVAVSLPLGLPMGLRTETVATCAATAFTVGCVGQGLYKAEPDRYTFTSVTLLVDAAHQADAERGVTAGRILGESTNLTRELVNRHPGELYPETFAERAQAEAAKLGIACEIMDEPRIRSERMGSLLGVSRGSVRPSACGAAAL